MACASSIFDACAEYAPSGDFNQFLKCTPPRWVVYLLADGDGRPIQLLCVQNLRASLKRRLGGGEMVGASRRVDYRELVRRVYWRRVDSAFEADCIYLEAARSIFPQAYRGMVGFRPAWFVHVDPSATFPRFVRTTDLGKRAGRFLGPLEDKHAAGRLIELAEDVFDLCRYYNVLTAAPAGNACAYKEMGRCPAPCDGSIAMPHYRRLVEWAVGVIASPGPFVREHTRRMGEAAAELRFESAGRIKSFLAAVSQFGAGPFRHVRPVEDFKFVSVQRGPRLGTAKLFLITPGRVEEILGMCGEPTDLNELLGVIGEVGPPAATLDSASAERIGVVAHHLFLPKQAGGQFLPLSAVDETALAKAYREVVKQVSTSERPAPDEGEGLLNELQPQT